MLADDGKIVYWSEPKKYTALATYWQNHGWDRVKECEIRMYDPKKGFDHILVYVNKLPPDLDSLREE